MKSNRQSSKPIERSVSSGTNESNGGMRNYLVNSILRPPRATYSDDDLGPNLMKMGDNIVIRHDFDIPNLNGFMLKVSLWKKLEKQSEVRIIKDKCTNITKYCIVYLHCNSSSRTDVLKGPQGTTMLEFAMSSSISCPYEAGDDPDCSVSLCSFDFAGCGHSQGDIVTLGHRERGDVRCVLDFLSAAHGYKKFALWGRSMGAVSALMFAENCPFDNCDLLALYREEYEICCLVLDSPFADFKRLTQDVVSMLERNAQKAVNSPAVAVRSHSKDDSSIQSSLKQESKANEGTHDDNRTSIKSTDSKFMSSFRKKPPSTQVIKRPSPGLLAHIVATTGIPGFISNGLVSMIRKAVMKRANFDIFCLSPVTHTARIKIPTLFLTALQDDVVPHHHGDDLYESMVCPSIQVRFRGTHNSRRYGWLIKSSMEFVCGVFQMSERMERSGSCHPVKPTNADVAGNDNDDKSNEEDDEDDEETAESFLRRITLVIRYLLFVQQQQNLEKKLRRLNSKSEEDRMRMIDDEKHDAEEEVRYHFGRTSELQVLHSSNLLPASPADVGDASISGDDEVDGKAADSGFEYFEIIQALINWLSFSNRSSPDSDSQDRVDVDAVNDHVSGSGLKSPKSVSSSSKAKSVVVSHNLFRSFSSSSSDGNRLQPVNTDQQQEPSLQSPPISSKSKEDDDDDRVVENPILMFRGSTE